MNSNYPFLKLTALLTKREGQRVRLPWDYDKAL